MLANLSACKSVCLPEWTSVIHVCRGWFFYFFFYFRPLNGELGDASLAVRVETLIGGGRSGAVWSTALQGHEWLNSGRGELCPPDTRRQKNDLLPVTTLLPSQKSDICNSNKESRKCLWSVGGVRLKAEQLCRHSGMFSRKQGRWHTKEMFIRAGKKRCWESLVEGQV